MDRDTICRLRENLCAMRGIVRAWSGPQDAETPLAMEWLLGLIRVLRIYPMEAHVAEAVDRLEIRLRAIRAGDMPGDAPAELMDRIERLIAAVDAVACPSWGRFSLFH